MAKHDYVLCYAGVDPCWHVKPEDLERIEMRDGVRYREETTTVKTVWNHVGQIEQLAMTPSDVMQRRVLNTMERQVREALIALGWTPPTGAKK